MNNKLPKKNILKKKIKVDEFFKKAKKKHGSRFTIFYSEAEEGNEKVAFFISKRVGSAVLRNKSKRIIREFYRINKTKFLSKNAIFVIRKPIIKLKQLDSELNIELK